MLKTLIIYGNCQAEAISTIFRKDPVTEESFRVLYLRSFDHPSDGWDELRGEDVANCAVLCEQHDPRPFPYRDLLPAGCHTVTFPAIDFTPLWPFSCPNPYNVPEPPVFPFGRFPYGDRIIIESIDKKMPPKEILSYYLSGWVRYGMDLDRLLQVESARLTARDSHCDVKMSDFVLENFRQERLFWSNNHPTSALLRELIHRLLAIAEPLEPLLDELDLDATISYRLSPEGPLGAVSIPVHPKIAAHFGLEWYDAGERHQSFGGLTYSGAEYFDTMIREAISFRAMGKRRKVISQAAQPRAKTLIVSGDVQAEALAGLLRGVPRVAERFEIVYANHAVQQTNPNEKLADCAVLCEQQSSDSLTASTRLPQDCLRVTFPRLELNLLWPFNCVNLYNEPEPPEFRFGRFPYGDSFVLNCVDRDVPPDDIMRHCLSAEWNQSWPDLDQLQQREGERLLALDAENTVKIGSYILNHFRTERLFWSVNNPTNKLFADLLFQVLHACFGSMIERSTADLGGIAAREIFGTLNVPIHRKVAKHFGLTWCDPRERYNYFDRAHLSYNQYFEKLIETSYSFKRLRAQTAG
jgi:hypothetical protein